MKPAFRTVRPTESAVVTYQKDRKCFAALGHSQEVAVVTLDLARLLLGSDPQRAKEEALSVAPILEELGIGSESREAKLLAEVARHEQDGAEALTRDGGDGSHGSGRGTHGSGNGPRENGDESRGTAAESQRNGDESQGVVTRCKARVTSRYETATDHYVAVTERAATRTSRGVAVTERGAPGTSGSSVHPSAPSALPGDSSTLPNVPSPPRSVSFAFHGDRAAFPDESLELRSGSSAFWDSARMAARAP
jgi:hypothetical protein